jgi:hypothetical protein
MNRKQFQRYLDRDTGACYHCGLSDDTLVPGHRLGRGAGGSKLRDVPSNILTQCSWFNNEIETHAEARNWGRSRGLSLENGQSPLIVPAFHMLLQQWVKLDDDFNLHTVTEAYAREHIRDLEAGRSDY